MPLGRNLSSLISPTGSGNAAISRTPSAIAATLDASSASRSTNAASLPAPCAAATSCALADSRLLSSRMIARAIASSAAFFAAVGARAKRRDAARARSPTSRMYAGRSRPGTLRLVMRDILSRSVATRRPGLSNERNRRGATVRSELVRVERPDAGVGPDKNDVGAAIGEQAVGDDADDVVDLRFELDRIHDAHVLDVEDDVAIVGDEVRAQLRVTAVLGHLVGAVDVDGQHVDRGEVEHGDAVTLQPLCRLDRARHRTLDAMLDLRQLVDEKVGRRAAAHADVGIVDDVPDRF